MILIIVSAVVLIMVCYEVFYDRKVKIYGKKIPGPPIYPIVGNGLIFIGSSKNSTDALEYLFREFGGRARAFLGTELFVFVSNREDVEALLSNMEYVNKSQDYESLKPWLGEGLLTSSGARWKKHRKFLTPTFHFSILQDFVPVFERTADVLVQMLSARADSGRVFDIYPYITLCALDGICETAMGVSMEAQTNSNSEYVRAVNAVAHLTNSRMRNFLLRNEFIFSYSQNKTEQDKALKILHGFTENIIQLRKKQIQDEGITLDNKNELGLKNRTTFLDMLLLSELDGEKLSDQSVREEVDTFMFEGHDTTTSAISFALYLIGKHPDVQHKLYQEQETVFQDDFNRTSTHSDLNEMKYMDLVIKEVLRLYPSVPLLARSIRRDTVINGMEMPAGSTIVADVFHLHRNPAVYTEPLEFRPERFENDRSSLRNPFSWVAFSAGPRNCIGQKFAILEIKSVLSRLLRAYELRSVDAEEPQLLLELIIKPSDGINMKIAHRATTVSASTLPPVKSVKLRQHAND